MYNSRIILVVNLFMTIYFSTMETEATRYFFYHYDEEITEQEAVKYLTGIKPKEVLPLILMLASKTKELLPPQRLDEVFISNGRIINGTQFTSKNTDVQLLFCPIIIPGENCLLPKEFKEKNALECLKEFKPLVRKAGDNLCGAGNIGKSHTVLYDMCPRRLLEIHEYQTKEIPLYGFCYDGNNQKTIFTSHTIGYPELLDSVALRPEHDVKYNMEETNEFIPSNIQDLKDALEQDEGQMSKIPNYKTQKLTPPEDLTFATSRKSTYRYFNAELQHKTLFPLWDKMSEKIRNHAKEMYFKEEYRFSINTGVFDLSSKPREDGQKSNVWVKLIFASKGIADPMYGMVILMNNFIDKNAELSEPTEKSVLDYCKDDRCEKTLNQEFKELGSRVRCCSMNEDFKGLFRWQNVETISSKPSNNTQVQLLRIPGINGLDQGTSSEMAE